MFAWFCFYHLSGFHVSSLCVCVCVCVNPLYCHDKWLVESRFPDQKFGLSLWGGSTEFRMLDSQRTYDLRVLIGESSHEGFHPNPRPGTTQLPAAPSVRWFSETRQEYRPNHQQTDCPETPQNTSHTLPIRGKILISTNQNIGTSVSQHKAYIIHWAKLPHWGQRPEVRWTMTLYPGERRTVTVS